MAGETFSALTPPSGSTFIAGHAARASQIERIRQCLVILGKKRPIGSGGSDTDGHDGTSYARLRNTVPIPLCEEDYRGFTVTAYVRTRVLDAAGTVRVRLRNTDDNSTVAEMVAAVSVTTLTDYTLTVTLPAGTTRKNCEWQIQVSNALYPGYAVVWLEYGL
jgi:hypothetical protein